MRIALVQINPVVGDFAGNCAKILGFTARARELGCDLAVFPELALIGYPPRDLLEKNGFVAASQGFWPQLAAATESGIGLLVGAVTPNREPPGKPFHNSALFFAEGKLQAMVHKRLLPSYDVFDEERYFEPGRESRALAFRGRKIGVTICEDVWNVDPFLPRPLYHCDPVKDLAAQSIDLLVNLSASPFHLGKAVWVGELLRAHALRTGVPLVYVNQVGGNDELIFQGRGMVWDERGQLVASGADFAEDLVVFDSDRPSPELHHRDQDGPAEIAAALVLGLRDYAAKCGFTEVVLGLSGGIDSAVVACLAALALGPEKVHAVAMPGPYNAPESLIDARELAKRLGIHFDVVDISALFDCARASLEPLFADRPADVTEENLQARLRGLVLMAVSNKFNRLLINTGNKSELAVGYCTLYGDMNGGLSVLGDVPKTMVYALARHLNAVHGWIPERIIRRPPSAELRPDQKDEDSLPPYGELDAILAGTIERRLSVAELTAEGHAEAVVRWVIDRVDRNEYKRWQAPPVLRVTTKAFGSGRRCPIAHRYHPWEIRARPRPREPNGHRQSGASGRRVPQSVTMQP